MKKKIKVQSYYFLESFKEFSKDDIKYFNKLMGHPEKTERKEDDSFEITVPDFKYLPQIGGEVRISELYFRVENVILWYDDNMVLDEICISIQKLKEE